MAEPTSLSLILTSAIGCVSGTLASKMAEVTPGIADRLKQPAVLAEQLTLTEIDRVLVDEDSGAFTDPIRELDNQPFAEDITRRLVYRVPPPGNENPHVNLWLFTGVPPSNGLEMEKVIEKFEFVPSNPLGVNSSLCG